ncbi:MAG: murein hydrolase activator EnvC family protein [Acidocella sp.]|uniref:murein hydrolase activator EnvC family protein n=1 Tax=Acidocella sp. TaxID=50710 RepID=UPI003FD85A52
MKLRAALCLTLALAPVLAGAEPARHHKHAHHLAQAAAAAPAPSDADADADAEQAARQAQQQATALATALGQQQAQAAASIRKIETQTAQDAAQLANIQAAQGDAAQHLTQAEAALARLVPVMQRLSTQPASTLLTAPLPPEDAVRSVALLQGVAAAIATQAQAVQAQNAQLAQLIAATAASQAQLADAVTRQQAAESALSAQIDAAKAAEQAAADQQAAAQAQKLAAAHKLDNLNDAVNGLVPPAPTPASLAASSGAAPVAGNIVQAYGATTLAGPSTGVSYGTGPGARVTTPCAGTVMFAGAFPSYGNMVITDCGGGTSVVLAGMDHLDVAQGQRLVKGQPIGSMRGYDPTDPTRQPRLYVELRRNGAPVDPTSWLAGRGSG